MNGATSAEGEEVQREPCGSCELEHIVEALFCFNGDQRESSSPPAHMSKMSVLMSSPVSPTEENTHTRARALGLNEMGKMYSFILTDIMIEI